MNNRFVYLFLVRALNVCSVCNLMQSNKYIYVDGDDNELKVMIRQLVAEQLLLGR